MLDASVILVSIFVYPQGIVAIMLSLVMLFCTSKMSEIIMQGFKTATKFEVITTQPEELGEELIKEIGRGVTKIDAVGMYSHQKKAIITCIIRKRQIPAFYKILKKYPDAFAYITNTNEVIGIGFSRPAATARSVYKHAPKIGNASMANPVPDNVLQDNNTNGSENANSEQSNENNN